MIMENAREERQAIVLPALFIHFFFPTQDFLCVYSQRIQQGDSIHGQ